MALKRGDKAPEILGVDQTGKEIRLSDFAGSKLILYFYPKDNTPGCTAEACSLRDHYAELQASGYAVIGVSKDGEASHRKFIEKQSLPFSLIADTECKLNEAFGVWREKKRGRRSYLGNVPAHFYRSGEGGVTEYYETGDKKKSVYIM